MLTPEKMRKVRIIVLKSVVGNLIKALHEKGIVELRKVNYKNLERGRPLDFYDVVSDQLVKLRAISAVFYKYYSKKLPRPILLQSEEAVHEAAALNIAPILKSLNEEAEKLENDVVSIEKSLKTVSKLLPFRGIDFSKLRTATLDYFVGELPAEKLDSLKKQLDRLTKHYTLLTPNKGPDNFVILIYDKKPDSNVNNVLSECGFVALEIPENLTLPSVMLTRLEDDLVRKKARLVQITAEITELAKNNIKKVESLKYSLEVAADRTAITSYFGTSRDVMFLGGWVQAKEYRELQGIVAEFGSAAHFEDCEILHDEMPPVVLNNPKLSSPFEFVTLNYSLPNAVEIDPTMIYFITLPLLYGMIVGDVLYGLMSMLIASWLMKKFENSNVMSNVSRVWFYSALPTMLFGVLFDEWGGMGHAAFVNNIGSWFGLKLLDAPLYAGFHRMKEIAMLIAISALVGIVHIAFGLIIGAINEWSHHRKHAYAKIAWLGVEFGGLLAILVLFFNLFSDIGSPVAGLPLLGVGGIVLLVLSVIALFFTEGIIGVIEIPGLLGNILSYSRIAAIGVVGVIIAELLNKFIMPVPSQGIFALLVFPIFLGLHFVNCFIAMFEALIQGGRLNLIEFKSKFLRGGGVLFAPFSLRSK